jgi:uncharacterized 2Fe-2S/4Fe-4S cluster protein (DUF4445 family)
MKGSRVTFHPEGKRVDTTIGQTLFDTAGKLGVDIQSLCGGRGICGKCRVIVRSGMDSLSHASDAERRFLSESEVETNLRLACQAAIKGRGPIVVEVPQQSRVGQQRLLVKGLERPVQLTPSVRRLSVSLKKPSLLDVESDASRLLRALRRKSGEDIRIDYEALKRIPHALREGNWDVTAITWMDRELIFVKPERQSKSLYGMAVDIGTTKIAAYLLNLDAGEISATVSMMNPQIPYGEDVISRISYIMKDEKNLEKMNRIVITGINELIDEACEKAGIDPKDIYDMIVVGNTAMHHIFLSISPKYVSLSPYPAVVQSSVDVKARDLGVRMNCGAYVHVFPAIAGFVGADAVADALATGIYESEELTMLVDIGTNTEIILGDKEKILSCSCASGPAFEGAHIKHGMRAATGAIEHIWIDPKTLEVGYSTIGNVKPSGLCGSAIVDAVAQFLKTGMIAPEGNFQRSETERLRRNENKPEFVIAWSDESSTGDDIVVTQGDVREVQLAKAAIYTGAAILMKRMKVDFRDIKKVFIAGAFGNYVDPQSARTIGMFPDVPIQNVQFVGNTAGSGARMALLSTQMRRVADEVARKIEYIELGADPDFHKEFLNATYFPHKELERFPSEMRLMEKD